MIEFAIVIIVALVGVNCFTLYFWRRTINKCDQWEKEAHRVYGVIRSLNKEIHDLKNPQRNLPELFSPEQFAKYHNRRWHDGNKQAVDKALKWDDAAKGELP